MCLNKLEIIGDTSSLEEIKNNFSLSWFKPCSENFKNNWGTKKELFDERITINDNVLKAYFRTYKYPPIEAISGLAERYLKLDITLNYINYEDQVYGEVVWDDGEIVVDIADGFEESLENMSILDIGDL